MFDTHAHLCFKNFDKDRVEVVEECRKSLSGVIVSSARYDESICVLDLVKKHPNFLYASIGCHPTECTEVEKTVELIKKNKERVIAVGEVGLDYHWEKDPEKREQQKRRFETFISLAEELGKPLVIHSWDAEKEAFEIVKDRKVEATFHCYTGKKELAMEIIKRGFYISISTNVLFSKSIQKIAKSIPLNRILLETDSPFLDPDRERRRNTPENIALSAKKIAELRKLNVEEVKRATAENTKRLFKI